MVKSLFNKFRVQCCFLRIERREFRKESSKKRSCKLITVCAFQWRKKTILKEKLFNNKSVEFGYYTNSKDTLPL